MPKLAKAFILYPYYNLYPKPTFNMFTFLLKLVFGMSSSLPSLIKSYWIWVKNLLLISYETPKFKLNPFWLSTSTSKGLDTSNIMTVYPIPIEGCILGSDSKFNSPNILGCSV